MKKALPFLHHCPAQLGFAAGNTPVLGIRLVAPDTHCTVYCHTGSDGRLRELVHRESRFAAGKVRVLLGVEIVVPMGLAAGGLEAHCSQFGILADRRDCSRTCFDYRSHEYGLAIERNVFKVMIVSSVLARVANASSGESEISLYIV